MSVPSGNIKGSLHTSTSISKRLLTPCRRIGLSRKSKPMLKIFKNILQETQSTGEPDANLQHNKDTLNPVNNLEDCTVSQRKELPLLRKKDDIKVVAAEHPIDVIDSIKIQKKKRHAVAVSIKFLADSSNTQVTFKVVEKKSESSEWLDHLQKIVIDEEKKQPADDYTPPDIRLDDLKELQSKELKDHVTRVDHSAKRKNESFTPHRKVKRKLSMKTSTNSWKTDLSDTDDETGLLQSDVPSNNIILEDTYVTADDGNISLQDAEEVGKENKLSLINEVLQLEKHVREKEVELSRLQQAEVYRKIHNVEDLDKLTNTWKSKCQEALRDLLDSIKEHSTINMTMLLKNLRAPSSLINYNSEEDIFV